VAGRKRDRQRVNRQRAAALAAREAKRQAQRRRVMLLGGGAVVLLALVLVFLLTRDSGSDKENLNADEPTKATSVIGSTTSTTAMASAAGKPCVKVSEPLPPGAPNVGVKEGPPPTSLIKEDIKEGTGATVAAGDTVKANYIGVSCSTGKIFDSSYSRGQAAEFSLAQVIKGWTDGIPGMKVGGQRLLGIPADQAYGAEGRPPTIAPNESLWFVVEIVDTKPAAPPAG
jgi:peptidylprolyl isomerase